MNQFKKYWIYAVLLAIIVFGWGLGSWLMARLYQPEEPVQAPLQSYKFSPKENSFPLSRYESLMDGHLFFGGAIVSSQVEFSSKLVLWGVVKDETAVVGLDPTSNQDTKVVRVGGYYAGEQIIAIGSNYVVVRNATGEGRVGQ